MGKSKYNITRMEVATKLMELGGFHTAQQVADILNISRPAASGHVGRIIKSDEYITEHKSLKGNNSRKNALRVIGIAKAEAKKACNRQAFIDLICFKKPLGVA